MLIFYIYMIELDMEIKYNRPFCLGSYHVVNKGLNCKTTCPALEESLTSDVWVKGEEKTRPVVMKKATGLVGFIDKLSNSISNYINAYKNNIVHTCQHKLIFFRIEKELFGRNTIDSITHDLDKLILYMLGFPHDFVFKLHRKISEHHVNNKKVKNLRSMLCDNIASSPEFKPEKKYSLRKYYKKNKELQKIKGFGEILKKYKYGENLNFEAIKNEFLIKNKDNKHILRKTFFKMFTCLFSLLNPQR